MRYGRQSLSGLLREIFKRMTSGDRSDELDEQVAESVGAAFVG